MATEETAPDENEKRKKDLDRRSGEDRRQIYSLDYFAQGGLERRIRKERRSHAERRKGWVRTGRWTSISPDISSD